MEKDEIIREQPFESEQAQESIVDFEEKAVPLRRSKKAPNLGNFLVQKIWLMHTTIFKRNLQENAKNLAKFKSKLPKRKLKKLL